MRISVALIVSLGMMGTACKSRPYNDQGASEESIFGFGPTLTNAQKTLRDDCLKTGAKRDLCTTFAVTGGSKQVYKGTVQVLDEQYIERWALKIKTGEACEMQFAWGQSYILTVANGEDLFVRMQFGAYDPNASYRTFNEPARTFEVQSPMRFVHLQRWIERDKNYNIVKFGFMVGPQDGVVKEGTPVYECKISEISAATK